MTNNDKQLDASKEMLINKPQPVWSGDGLPPVGCECEYKDYSTSEWHPVTITYCSNQVVVFSSKHKTFKGEPVEISKDLIIDSPEFRTIRVEAERKREEAIKHLSHSLRAYGSVTDEQLSRLYADIAAGVIPGLKLEAPDDH